MIELLTIMTEELEKTAGKIHGPKARLKVSPQRKRSTKAQAVSFKGLLLETSEILQFWRKISQPNAPEGEGQSEEGWIINLPVVSAMRTDLSDTLFETMVK